MSPKWSLLAATLLGMLLAVVTATASDNFDTVNREHKRGKGNFLKFLRDFTC